MNNRFDKHRRSIRLKNYNYSQAGAYFVTIVARDRRCAFGEIVDGAMRLNHHGSVVTQCWECLPEHFQNVQTDAFVGMPNHVHGIVAVGARHAVPLHSECERFAKPVSASLPTIIRSFKSACSKQINELGSEHPGPVWQRNYFEHVIRNEDSLSRIRQYILDNPMRWEFDRENPVAMKPEADYAWRQ